LKLFPEVSKRREKNSPKEKKKNRIAKKKTERHIPQFTCKEGGCGVPLF
jgi:hypothetical protein